MWEHERLSIKSVQFLSSLPDSLSLTIKGKKILIIHYATTNGKFKRPIPNPDASSLKAEFNLSEADVIVYGHNHSKSYIEDNTIYINPGSLGCPGRKHDIARAGVLEVDKDIKYEQLEIKYDVSIVLNKIEEYDYPAKEEIKKFFFGINR
jgi:predicted phosphodiesterase